MKGSTEEKVLRVVMAPAVPLQELEAAKSPPTDRYMFFLKPATQSGYYTSTAIAGVVGETAQGLETVVEPTQSNMLSTGLDKAPHDLDDLQSRVEELA